MDFPQAFLTVTLLHLVGAISPGPDFVLVSQQSMASGRRAGVLCSLGIALGLSVHVAWSGFGVAAAVSRSGLLLTLVQIAAIAFLLYLGLRGLASKPWRGGSADEPTAARASSLKLVTIGFFCNALNPKAPLYFMALFALVLSPDMPAWQVLALGAWMMVIQFGWFSCVALLLSRASLRDRFRSRAHWVDRTMGALFVLFALRLLWQALAS